MKEFTHSGHDVTVRRIENYHNDRPGMPHELVAEIDGEEIMTATRLERQYGYDFEEIPNWTRALENYAKAYIDGGD